MGDAWIDTETGNKGMFDFYWTHALISDGVIHGINSNCNFTKFSKACASYLIKAYQSMGNINILDIYAPLCSSSFSTSSVQFCCLNL